MYGEALRKNCTNFAKSFRVTGALLLLLLLLLPFPLLARVPLVVLLLGLAASSAEDKLLVGLLSGLLSGLPPGVGGLLVLALLPCG